jgi:hypothetical protein
MEHFYQNIDGFMNHKNTIMLDIVLSEIKSNCVWVELGSWTGKSAAYCAVELINSSKIGKFYCIDSWKGGEEHYNWEILKDLKQIFINNVTPVANYITIIENMSWDAAEQFEDNSVDFCYVDAGHTYECVTNDLTAWWPKIKPGSYFGGDDYTKGFPDLEKAVQNFFFNKKIKIQKVGRCWLVKK